jgi:hypothetical protein
MYSLVSNIKIDLSNNEGFLSKAITVDDIDNRNNINEAVIIAERILSDCLEDSIRHSAIQVLCYYYPLLGNRDKAIQLANSMPPLYINRDCLLEDIYENDQRILQIQKNIQQTTDYLCSEICSIADPDSQQKNNISIDEKIHLFEIANSIYQLVYENGDYNFYNCRLANNYRVMAALAVSNSCIDDTLSYLEKAAEYAMAADRTPISSPYTSLLVNRLTNNENINHSSNEKTQLLNDMFHQMVVSDRIVFRVDKTLAKESRLLLKKLENSRYDNVRNAERFKAIVEKLQKA